MSNVPGNVARGRIGKRKGAIGISYCTTCMGRLHHLRQTLPANLEANAGLPVEFIVLDYNSPDGVGDWIRSNFLTEIEAGRLVYGRTTEPRFFNMAHAKNVAHRLASGRIVCNVDADNFVSGEFTRWLLKLFAIRRPIIARGVNIQSYWGRIALLRRWFQRLGGYDEKLGVRWGYEDSDLICRALRLGLEVVSLPEAFGKALTHSDVERLENFPVKFDHRNDSHAFNEALSRRNLAKNRLIANQETFWGRARLEINFQKAVGTGRGAEASSLAWKRTKIEDPLLLKVIAELTSTVFDYNRVGYDRRRMAFLPSGLVGRGAARCETYWRVKRVRSRVWLEIMSECALTCRLTRGKDRIWRGNWVDFEKMPIELRPFPRK